MVYLVSGSHAMTNVYAANCQRDLTRDSGHCRNMRGLPTGVWNTRQYFRLYLPIKPRCMRNRCVLRQKYAKSIQSHIWTIKVFKLLLRVHIFAEIWRQWLVEDMHSTQLLYFTHTMCVMNFSYRICWIFRWFANIFPKFHERHRIKRKIKFYSSILIQVTPTGKSTLQIFDISWLCEYSKIFISFFDVKRTKIIEKRNDGMKYIQLYGSRFPRWRLSRYFEGTIAQRICSKTCNNVTVYPMIVTEVILPSG